MSDVVEEFKGDIWAIPFYNPPIPKSDPGKLVDEEFGSDMSRMPVVLDAKKVADEKSNRKQLTQESLQWPISCQKNDSYFPVIVAAAVALYFAPLTVPTIGMGELVAASYAAGAVTYYFQNQGTIRADKK